MEKNLEDLYKIYRSNIKMDLPSTRTDNYIQVGDIVVAMYNNREVKGEIGAVYESYYSLKGKNGSTIKITIDDINEHYPKNRMFESKNIKKFSSMNENDAVSIEEEEKKPEQKVQRKRNKIEDDFEKDQEKNNPDNQVDLTIEKDNSLIEDIKPIGKLLYYRNMKHSDIMNMFEKKLLNKEELWYLLTEKENEIHVVKNNEKGFQIQPFVTALVGHFLKKDDKLNEAYNQIKIAGNNNFSVISNIPQNVHKQLLSGIIGLLSGIKNK